jgi:hypothetical protein
MVSKEDTTKDGSIIGKALTLRIKKILVNKPELGYGSIRDFARKAVEKELQEVE